uniref:Uncharacterized protein n=1 Tax=Anguilla anguilla TaxID=7936 RepID=A0A0E9W2M4_ANGAN
MFLEERKNTKKKLCRF